MTNEQLIAELVEALSTYSVRDNYAYDNDCCPEKENLFPILEDEGDVARAALAKAAAHLDAENTRTRDKVKYARMDRRKAMDSAAFANILSAKIVAENAALRTENAHLKRQRLGNV